MSLVAIAIAVLKAGSILNGRIFALNSVVTLDNNTVVVCSAPAPGLMLKVGVCVVVIGRGGKRGSVGRVGKVNKSCNLDDQTARSDIL
jgi:hypothetical protein